jgi:gamma-glutamylcyclotransferase (GGCT)/AIG2-like uncharacterized protein YtfP
MDTDRLMQRGIQFFTVQPAILDKHSLVFNKIADRNGREGYANIVPAENSFVQGILYSIPADDLCRLDRFEGVPFHYQRKEIKVFTVPENNIHHRVVVYVAAPENTRNGLRPSRKYLKHMLTAADRLFPEYIDYLDRIETLD